MSDTVNIIISAQTGAAVKGLDQVTQSTQRVGQSVQNAQAKMGKFNKGVTAGNVNIRKFAMGGLQQAGYQVGDFAVQVANGTSKMQAFGQQAPQLLQIFGPVGAIAGAAVAIFAAFYVTIDKTTKSTKNLAGSLMPLDDALKSIKKSTGEARAEIALLASGFKTAEEASLANAISLQKQVVAQKELIAESARGIAKAGAGTQLTLAKERLQTLEEELRLLRSGTEERGRVLDGMRDILGTSDGLRQAELALNELYASRLGTIDDTANKYVDILGSENGLQVALDAVNALHEARLGTIDNTANKYVDILGSENGLQLAVEATNALYRARLGTIDDTANKYVDILGSENGLQAATAATNALFESRIGTIDDTANTYVDILGSTEGLAAATEALNQIFEDRNKAISKTATTIDSELSPAMKRLNGIMESVGQSFEDAMMSAVDGTRSTKDAFRSMAAEIIKELYRVFVVKQITGFITSAVGGYFNANQVSGPSMPLGTGNVRPQARTFAGGGYTGNGPRAGGLDGKGGFMAMLHPRETVTDHTKGQGSGSVVQNFYFSANGDDSVKKLIAQAAPQIAKMTEKGIIDSRRRGGQFRQVFG